MSDLSTELYFEHCNRMEVIALQAELAREMLRPFYTIKPTFMGIDGDHYWFLYGINIQEGCAGFGRSMEEAARDFDVTWTRQLPPSKVGA